MKAKITEKEKNYLRDLAKRQQEIAALPIMKERENLWYAHNSLQGDRPVIVMEEDTFLPCILPERVCETPLAREMETALQKTIKSYELIDDDKVVPDYYTVYDAVSLRPHNLELKKIYASDGLGFHIEPVFDNLEEGLPLMEDSVFLYDREKTAEMAESAQEIFGDILPIRRKNQINHWEMGITQRIVNLMGMENMYCSMMEEPDAFHQFMERITDDMIRLLRWEEDKGLLYLNHENDYMGSGSFCFTKELPGPGYDGKVKSRDTWGHLNSQESIGVSPDMFREFIYPSYERLAQEFGLLYYGCCEPVDRYWESCLSRIPNLRKISISPWCNEEYMGERLREGQVIYSRKPSPNYLGVRAEFDKDAFEKHIRQTLLSAKGCKLEFIFRDIYDLHGNLEKLKQAVQMTRNLSEEFYR